MIDKKGDKTLSLKIEKKLKITMRYIQEKN